VPLDRMLRFQTWLREPGVPAELTYREGGEQD
jgi:hypothetical protein